jgi:hypothetical protein
MQFIPKILMAAASLAVLGACGGGNDVTDAGGTSDPQVRFVNVSPTAPALTLARNGINRAEATNVSNVFFSDYFAVDAGNADYRISGQHNTGNPASPDYAFSQTISVDAKRGRKYTILAVVAAPQPGVSTTQSNTLVLVDDPTNRSLWNDDSYVRAVNGSFNAPNVDLYLIGLNETIDTQTPDLPAISFKQSNPVSGSDSVGRRSGDYQVVATVAGTKNILYRGHLTVPAKSDVLFVTVPYVSFSPNGTGVAIAAQIQGSGRRGGVIPPL